MPSAKDIVKYTKQQLWDYHWEGRKRFLKDVLHALNIIASDYDCTIQPLSDVLIFNSKTTSKVPKEARLLAEDVYGQYRRIYSGDLGWSFVLIDGEKSITQLLKEYEDKYKQANKR
jgi:hypothetical protein